MGVAIAATAGAAAGASPPAPVLGPSSVDWRGGVTFGTGTAPTAGAMVSLKSGVAYSGAAVAQAGGLGVSVFPMNAATAALGPWYAQWDSNSRTVTFYCTVAPAASQGNATYSLSYIIYSD